MIKTYSFKEYAELRQLPKQPIISSDLVIKGLSIAIPMMVMSIEMCYAKPSTGNAKLDNGMWKIVGVFQSAIFWMSMVYSLKSMLEVLLKGEGSMKKVATGVSICAGAYLIPWLFEIIRDSFN